MIRWWWFAKAKFEALRKSGELAREKAWDAEQQRRRASLEDERK